MRVWVPMKRTFSHISNERKLDGKDFPGIDSFLSRFHEEKEWGTVEIGS